MRDELKIRPEMTELLDGFKQLFQSNQASPNRRTLVFGNNGDGKTMLAQKLCAVASLLGETAIYLASENVQVYRFLPLGVGVQLPEIGVGLLAEAFGYVDWATQLGQPRFTLPRFASTTQRALEYLEELEKSSPDRKPYLFVDSVKPFSDFSSIILSRHHFLQGIFTMNTADSCSDTLSTSQFRIEQNFPEPEFQIADLLTKWKFVFPAVSPYCAREVKLIRQSKDDLCLEDLVRLRMQLETTTLRSAKRARI